jgi:hypothetical protein
VSQLHKAYVGLPVQKTKKNGAEKMLVFFKVVVAFICDFLVLPASDGRYSTDHQEVLPKWNHRDGWNTADDHHKVQRGDCHWDAGRAATKSGKEANVPLKDGAPVIAITKGAMSDIKSNTFVGITAMPQPDGTQKAVEVHVFEESLRGTVGLDAE